MQKAENDIFGIIVSLPRCSIILMLKDRGMRPSEISRKTNLSMQALVKHIKKMTASGLIEKRGSALVLTSTGSALVHQINAIRFLNQNRELFKTHSLAYLPRTFVERIGELHNFEAVKGYVSTIEKYKQILDETKQFAKIIVAQVSLDIYKKGIPKFREDNVDVSYIMGRNALVPKGWLKLSREMNEHNMIARGIMRRRMLERVHLMMYISENEAFLAFPNHEGIVEPSIMLASRDIEFRRWCLDLFEYYWTLSTVFNEDTVHET